MAADRGLPASVEAESTILGSILLDNRVAHEAFSELHPEHFSIESHRRIFRAMQEVQAIDTVTLSEALQQKKELESVGGVAYLSRLIVGVPHTPSVAQYVRIVKDKYALRKVINAGNNAISRAYEQIDEPSSVISDLESDLLELVDSRIKDRTLPQIAQGFLADLEMVRKAPRELIGFTYGIQTLDSLTTGIREADYTLIAGRPAQGKSAFARMIAYLNALEGTRVHVFTPEVTAEQFFSMLVPLASNIPFYKVRRPKMLGPHDIREVMDATDRLMQLPMTIDDTSGIEIGELVAKAKMHISRGAQLVIVDYLQLVNARNARNERERVNAVSGGLRDLAKSTRVPVIALSQLSRPGERNVNERPTLYHLKESGNLEQDAYSVLLLYRPQGDQGFTGDDEVIVGKQRFGDTATVNVKFNKARVTFEERN